MKKLIFPALLLLLTCAGFGGGAWLGMQHAPVDDEHAEKKPDPFATLIERFQSSSVDELEVSYEYMKLNNQFIVPAGLRSGVKAMVVLSLSLEVRDGEKDAVYAHEPRLREAFLQALFAHANNPGFPDQATDLRNLTSLKLKLRAAAQQVYGGAINDVLITEFAYQRG